MDTRELASGIKGTVVTPGDENYETSIKRWAENSERKAAVVVLVQCAEDVSAALRFARANGLEIAVCGGGHSPTAASSTEGGLVIDLSKMREVQIDTKRNYIIAQGGCLWADVDAVAAKYGLATVGGTVNHTGIGGLTLGGGYGYLSGQYGMVIDNLRNVQMVLASGEIVQANEQENADLFWGVRGGGGNFGVVTEFTYQAYPHPNPIYSGLLVFPPPHLEAIVQAHNTWMTGGGQDPKTACTLVIGQDPPTFVPMIVVIIFYDGPEEEGRANFKPFFDVGPVADMTGPRPYVEQNGLMNEMTPHGLRRYVKSAGSRRLTVPVLQTLFNNYCEFVQKVGPDSRLSAVLYEYVPKQKIMSVPKGAMPFNTRGNWSNITILPCWGNRIDLDSYAKEWVHSLIDQLVVVEKQDEMLKPGEEFILEKGYYNASLGDEKLSAVYGDNYGRLRGLKRKYDPECVFKKWYPIAPAENYN